MSLMKTPRLADRSRRPGGGSVTARSSALSPRSPSLSSRSTADVRCELKGVGMDQRHVLEAKKRSMLVERSPHLLRRAHEVSEKAKNVLQLVMAKSARVPDMWRQPALELVEPIHTDVITCRLELLQANRLLQPPLNAFGIGEYERRYHRLERVLAALERVLGDVEEKFVHGEQWAACKAIQRCFRRYLARRGFYTKRLQINRRHRGLIPGIFDSIPEKSKLTVNHRTGAVTLEYPASDGLERGIMQ